MGTTVMKAEELLKQYAAGVRDFTAVNLDETKLAGAHLSGVCMQQATLNVANLTGVNLSRANLQEANLNVTRLSGANLSQSNLHRASLNVANLIRVMGAKLNLSEASLVQAELIRADLSGSNLQNSNLNEADLREAKLYRVNLRSANLMQADLRGCLLIEADLTHSNLHGADLSRADLQRASLAEAELRHARLHRTNLQGVNFQGANLRWADLSGADLRGANLSGAKLSGATLVGAILTDANLSGASLVHADLTQANLIQTDWTGADFSGVTLTGARLYGAYRAALMTEGMTCDWVDLSPNGDQSQIRKFASSADIQLFFSQVLPQVQVTVEGVLDPKANLVLALAYCRLTEQHSIFQQPPSLTIGHRHTVLTWTVERDELLWAIAALAILPFADAAVALGNLSMLVDPMRSPEISQSAEISDTSIQLLHQTFYQTLDQIQASDESNGAKPAIAPAAPHSFLALPTQVQIRNAQNQSLLIYQHPRFGQRWQPNRAIGVLETAPTPSQPMVLPDLTALLSFLHGFAR